MRPLARALIAFLATWFCSRLSLQVEIVALRHQLTVYQRSVSRPRLHPADRIFWSWLSRRWSRWREVLVLVQPATVIAWQRKRFRDHWTRISGKGTPGRSPVSQDVRELIRKISAANPMASPRRIESMGVEQVLSAPHSPWQNPSVERMIGSIWGTRRLETDKPYGAHPLQQRTYDRIPARANPVQDGLMQASCFQARCRVPTLPPRATCRSGQKRNRMPFAKQGRRTCQTIAATAQAAFPGKSGGGRAGPPACAREISRGNPPTRAAR